MCEDMVPMTKWGQIMINCVLWIVCSLAGIFFTQEGGLRYAVFLNVFILFIFCLTNIAMCEAYWELGTLSTLIFGIAVSAISFGVGVAIEVYQYIDNKKPDTPTVVTVAQDVEQKAAVVTKTVKSPYITAIIVALIIGIALVAVAVIKYFDHRKKAQETKDILNIPIEHIGAEWNSYYNM